MTVGNPEVEEYTVSSTSRQMQPRTEAGQKAQATASSYLRGWSEFVGHSFAPICSKPVALLNDAPPGSH